MKEVGLDIKKVKAVFISHEHTDHIRGIELFSKKHQVPVYITDATRRNGRVKLEKHLTKTFSSTAPVEIGRLSVAAFNKFHDAADPYSFTISSGEVQVGVFTDIGRPCANLVHHFKQCHAAFLESNYDEAMLANGNYPFHLKKRITGGLGHLSNNEALELFRTHRSQQLTHLFLSHLSQNNNSPALVQQLFDAHADGVKMIVASRTAPSLVYHIDAKDKTGTLRASVNTTPQQLQLALV
jgi:phosphoribosyl 1,2-cyclic phosphodiesterase